MYFLRRAIICILVFLLAPVFVNAQEPGGTDEGGPGAEIDIEEMRQRIHGESPAELMGFSLGDTGVSLFFTGSWKGVLQGNLGFSLSPLGTGFSSPESPLFEQEVDLGLSLWINDRWFVEANFLDDYDKNTYRAGFRGRSGEFVRYAGVGNTGLDFPSFPYLDLGGDSPSSFGFYGRFGGNDLDVHALVRYDAASREERVFSGGRERTYGYLQPNESIRGVSFVLPDENIDSEITVYIEDENGTIRDSRGRRWRLALSTEYAAGRTQGLLELTVRPSGMVAVAYSKGGNSQPWNTSMGNYGTSGFLNTVQRHFDSTRAIIKLEDYPQCGGALARPGEVIFGSIYALVVREPGIFSPFERQNRYDAPSSSAEAAALVRLSSGETISGFELVLLDVNSAQADIPLYTAAVSQRNVYELLPSGGSDTRDPSSRWPLAHEYPEVYLPGAGNFSGDTALRFTNYDGAGGYFIGTDAVPGSVQVWRSGIQDSNFNYNLSSGEVTLYGSVGRNELIRISYLKRSDRTRLGSVAAGLGAVYRKGASPFSAQTAVGVRWNLTEDSFTQEDQTSVGTVGISAKTAWEYDYLKAHVAAGFSFDRTDTTGLYRAAGMEGNETVLSLPPGRSFISHPPFSDPVLTYANRVDLIYRNYYDNSAFGNTLMSVGWNAPIVSGINRPYPVKDPQLGNAQVLTAEFSLAAGEWTGFQVPVNNFSGILSRAVEIEIPFRFYDFAGGANGIELIVQIGSLPGEDFDYEENADLVWEDVLFTASQTIDASAHSERFPLTDEDRLKLGDAKFLRIIAVNRGAGEISGRVMLAPPIIRSATFRPITVEFDTVREPSGDTVTAIETMETGTATLESFHGEIIRRLHPSDSGTQNTQRVLEINLKNMQPGVSAGVDGRIGGLPLSDYRELSFFVKATSGASGETLNFVVSSGPDSISDGELKASIPLSEFTPGQWSKVTIRYRGSGTGVFVDDANAAGASFSYRPRAFSFDDSERRTSYVAIFVSPANSSASLTDGKLFIDEIILEDSLLVYRMNAGAAIEYTRPGTLISIGNLPVVSDFSVFAALESEVRAGSETDDTQFSGSMVSRTGTSLSLLGASVTGNMAFTAAAGDSFLWSADHSVSREFGPFSVGEKFFASPYEKTAQHTFNMEFLSDFHAKFGADAHYDLSRLNQKWELGLAYTPGNEYIPSASINTQALWISKEQIDEAESYGGLWLRSWESMLPDTGGGADTRRIRAQVVVTQRTKPVGAVLTFDGATNFSGANNLTRSENTLFLDIPVVFGRTTLNFRAGRGYKRQLYFSGDDALDDIEKFFESINDSLPLWMIFPGYSLFAPELGSAMERGLINSPSSSLAQYTAFNDHFSAGITLPPVYNLSAFFVPRKASLRLERVLERKMDTGTDMLNLGIGLGHSAINMFGRLGYSPVFKFYQTDEFTHAVEGAVVIAKDEDLAWSFRSVLGAGFRGFLGATLNFVNTLTLRSKGYWLESFTADWTVPTNRSLLSVFYDWIAEGAAKQNSWPAFSALLNSEYEQLRRESLELAFDNTGDYLRWTVTAGHEEIIRILGRLEFIAFLKLKCGEDLFNDTFTFNALLGTSLRISF